jgi:hypothetical protein
MTKMLDLIESYLDQRGERACRIDGSIPWQERQANIRDFNSDPNTWLFLLSTRAGGLGINLTAADTVRCTQGCPRAAAPAPLLRRGTARHPESAGPPHVSCLPPPQLHPRAASKPHLTHPTRPPPPPPPPGHHLRL